ncbi:bacterial alpha-L-rhamnosidase-domain-containing protein [Aspergillus keveii]|uniref:alpha-L-rhamnosidase n=1 Tax=Aspergillus keveii TaxID=714993 RepID=A0ABR4G0P4_9EURO
MIAEPPCLTPPSFEQHPTGFGIGVASPRISWRFLSSISTAPGWEQYAYDVKVSHFSNSEVELYHVQSAESVLVPWPSQPLQSRQRARVRVRAYGTMERRSHIEPTIWSLWATLPRPITSASESQPDGPQRPLRFRRNFAILFPAVITRARLYITSFGSYNAYINRRKVGDDCFAPGWTSYNNRINYQVFDIADLINATGENVVAVEVGEGWYATKLGFYGGTRCIWGKDLAVLAQIEVVSREGEKFQLVSDDSWRCGYSAIIRSEIYDGELYDAREEMDSGGWTQGLINGSCWWGTRMLPFPSSRLVIPNAPSIRVTAAIRPLALAPLRDAKCTDEIITSKEPLQDWSPQYTYHGLRYVQVEGVSGLVMHTDMTRTGHFSCSHAMVNQLHENAVWSMRGNFLSVPTDCPQRDERLGWTGDIQIFCQSANVASEHLSQDHFIPPLVVPNAIGNLWAGNPQAVWDDVTVLTPWALYQSFGDVQILHKGVRRGPDGLWDKEHWQLGDWLDPAAPTYQPGSARTNATLVADAYLVHVTSIISQVSGILGEESSAARYNTDFYRLRQIFQAKYIAPSGLVIGDSQTALSLALLFSLHETEKQKVTAAERFAYLVRLAAFRVSTGFIGTLIITHAGYGCIGLD